jgi:hypothetical protein
MGNRRHWRTRFLTWLRKSANVREACQYAGVSRSNAYHARSHDAAFAQAWDDAVDEALEFFDGIMWQNAMEGTLRPVFYNGKKVAEVREYSEKAMIFLLRAKRYGFENRRR